MSVILSTPPPLFSASLETMNKTLEMYTVLAGISCSHFPYPAKSNISYPDLLPPHPVGSHFVPLPTTEKIFFDLLSLLNIFDLSN